MPPPPSASTSDHAGSARRIEFDDDVDDTTIDDARATASSPTRSSSGGRTAPPTRPPRRSTTSTSGAEVIAVRGLDDDALADVDRGASLSGARPGRTARHPRPLRVARPRPDRRRARDARPDVERALRAQDVPGAAITADDGDRVARRCCAQLRDRTDDDRRAVRAIGVRRQRRHRRRSRRATTIALKAETHNHPSAVEPFGGANTGVGGVIRDVLGAAHRPIAVTDVLCFGPADLPIDDAARRRAPPAAHPRRRRRRRRRLRQQDRPADGRRRGALRPGLHHQPAGVLPAASASPPTASRSTRPASRRPRRRARWAHRAATASAARRSPVADDGRHDRRGRRGQRADRRPDHREAADRRARRRRATCTRRSPTAAPAACRRRSARWPRASAPTSSSTLVPLKYPGLAPWEIWLSEAQERMVVAVPPDRPRRSCAHAARRHGVELADLGAFTGDGPPRRAPRRRRRARPRHRRSSTTAGRSAR